MRGIQKSKPKPSGGSADLCMLPSVCSGHRRGRTDQQAYQIILGSFLRKPGFQLTGGNYSMVLGGVHPQMDKGHPC